MSNAPEFRIIEHRGYYYIQRKSYETSGMLWWKKTEEIWTTCHENGSYGYFNRDIKPLPDLEYAKKQLIKISRPTQYFYLKDCVETPVLE